MAESRCIVDWNALSLNEGVELVAQALRFHLGVRLFVVTADGESVDITPASTVDTVFDHFVETNARWEGGGETATMVETRRQWTRALTSSEFDGDGDGGGRKGVIVETAPGFRAHLVPIRRRTDLVAGLVVAGFVPAEKAAESMEAIRSLLPDHLDERLDGDDEELTIVRLSRPDRRWIDRLAETMVRRLEEALERREPSLVDESGERFAGMLAVSEPMRSIFRKIETVATTDSTVLITGENGTGKELVARAVHRLSDRRNAPFLAVNCAAIPGELIASELFGHVEGAFSGARADRRGLFEAADGGTLLLDEIGEMEEPLQSKLLRVLQEGTLVRVGDTEVRNVDVRVLCATNSDLETLVQEGEFRRDLYFRIRVIEIDVPPLRDRREDVEVLARHFVGAAARRHDQGKKELDDACLEQLMRYDWPGNVRELENEVERLVIMSGDESTIDAEWLRPPIAEAEDTSALSGLEGRELPEVIEDVERKMILAGLRETGWNKTQTARDLGVSRRNLIRKVKQYELEQHRQDN